MRRRFRTLAITAGVALAAAVPVTGISSQVACADTDQRAVLVVDTGARELRYCVALNSDSVTGIELIRLAASQHGLQYRLGFGGKAVCQLDGVGPEGDDCFADYPDFWGYWRGDGSGGWTWSSVGAASTSVEPGDVEGWSWGSGQDASTHPQPPATTFDEVCPDVTPSPSPSGGGGGGGNGGGGGGGGSKPEPSPITSPTASPTPSPSQPRSGGARKHDGGERQERGAPAVGGRGPSGDASSPGDASGALALRATPAPSNAPAAGALIASIAIVLLLVAGGGLARRRRLGGG